jgi:choline dehydrogenase-like flavoprotein
VKDVVIVGSGAGGGPLALALSRAGFAVQVLEKGPEYERGDYSRDEVSSIWRGTFTPCLGDDPHVLVRAGLAAPRRSLMGWTACCVGGGTVHMGSYCSRLRPADFMLRSLYGGYEAVADWPYRYEDLEPYYTRAEWEVGVAGAAGSDPCEGPRSRPYPLPPLAANPLAAHLDAAGRRRGARPFPTPRAINSLPYEGRPACSYCAFCAGYGCNTGAKGSVQETLLARARATGRCEIRSHAMVREITLGPDGRARGCVYLDELGREQEVRARVVCVCCSAVESARLLLLSRSARFPDGLANDSGLVGRNLQFHATSAGQARFDRARHQGKGFEHPNPFIGRSLMDYYFLPAGVGELPKGGMVIFRYEGIGPVLRARMLAEQGPRLVWGNELKRRLRDFYCESWTLEFEVQHDFFPNDRTYVTLDPDVVDRWGLPVARIHLDAPLHHGTAGRWIVERTLEILSEMGADELAPLYAGETASFLVHGTCRAGKDPRFAVVDPYCRAHGVPNLFVVDGSFMPTSGGVPPTLTILANSFRTADHIIAQARSGDLC